MVKRITPKDMLKGAASISIAANRMSEMEENIRLILGHLENDIRTGSPGLVQRQREDRDRIEKLERIFDKIWIRLTLGSVMGGAAVSAIIKWIFKL